MTENTAYSTKTRATPARRSSNGALRVGMHTSELDQIRYSTSASSELTATRVALRLTW